MGKSKDLFMETRMEEENKATLAPAGDAFLQKLERLRLMLVENLTPYAQKKLGEYEFQRIASYEVNGGICILTLYRERNYVSLEISDNDDENNSISVDKTSFELPYDVTTERIDEAITLLKRYIDENNL